MSAIQTVSIRPDVQTIAQRNLVQALYREHHARLVTYATRILRNEDAAEDVVQDAFVAILGGDVTAPAVDVVRKLEAIVRSHCDERRNAMARERTSRRIRKEARRAYAATLRSLASPCRGEPDDDDKLEEVRR